MGSILGNSGKKISLFLCHQNFKILDSVLGGTIGLNCDKLRNKDHFIVKTA